jgi:hypothetical protein
MKIECILRRTPPTTVTLGETTYQFEVDAQGRHVCEVTDSAHLARLLSISEAYCLPGNKPVPEALKPAIAEHLLPPSAPVLAPVDEDVIKGSTVHPASVVVGGRRVEIGDAVFHALELSALTTREWNQLAEADRNDLIDLALDDLDESDVDGEDDEEPEAKPTPETAPVSHGGSLSGAESSNAPDATAADELADLQAQYLTKFGKKPNGKAGPARLRELLAEGE